MSSSIQRQRSPTSLINVVLDSEELLAGVRELDPPTLAALVRHIGVEDCGQLLALASAEQLSSLADDELWLAEGDGSEAFDSAQFGVWVEVLGNVGAGVAADALAALDEDLLAHALAQHLLVFDLDRLAPQMSAMHEGEREDHAELADKLLETSLSFELDELLLVSRRYQGWDALIDAILELDARDHALVRRILHRIGDASTQRVADDGLHTVLSEAESLAQDAHGARSDRREQRGFVSPADARAFLALARSEPSQVGDDPITNGYFRHYRPAPTVAPGASATRIASLLRERGLLPARPRLPAGGPPSPARTRLGELRETLPTRHAECVSELIYLANVLCAYHSSKNERPLSQVDAITAALSTIDAGMDAGGPDLAEPRSLIRLFALGSRHRSRRQ